MGKDARSSRSSRTPLAVTANKEGTEHAQLAENGAAMQVEMLEPSQRITDRDYRSICMPCTPLEEPAPRSVTRGVGRKR